MQKEFTTPYYPASTSHLHVGEQLLYIISHHYFCYSGDNLAKLQLTSVLKGTIISSITGYFALL